MKTHWIFLVFTFFLFSGPLTSTAEVDNNGIIKSVSGEVVIINPQNTVKAVPNMKIMQGDSIKTGPNSSVGLVFEDDTVISLGSNSEITIESFLFNPVEKQLSFVVRMAKGTFSFITGQIAKLAPTKVVLETPDATLSVRGTKFLVKID